MDDVTSGGNLEEVLRFKGKEDPETFLCEGTMPQIVGEAHLVLKAVPVDQCLVSSIALRRILLQFSLE